MWTRLLLLLPVVTAARRRRLGDALDMSNLRRLADQGQVGTELRFKLAAGTSAVRAASVAAAVDCSSAKRVFRPAGKHEAKHRAAGLDRKPQRAEPRLADQVDLREGQHTLALALAGALGNAAEQCVDVRRMTVKQVG